MAKVKTSDEFFAEFTTPVAKPETAVEEVVEKDIVLDELDHAEEKVETAELGVEEGVEKVAEETEEFEDVSEGEEEITIDDDGIVFVDDVPEVVEELDYVKLSQDLGFEGVKNKDQLLEKYKKDLDQAKEDALSGLPDALKEAILFAKEGGDFMEVLNISSIDYDKVSNRELLEAKYHKYFVDEDGKFDKDAFEEWVDSEGKAKVNMLADQIRSEEKLVQKNKLAVVRDKALRDKEKLNSELKTELDRIDSIGGVKLSQSQKDSMFRDTVSGLAMEEMFYEGGKISNKKLAQNLFKVRMFDKAIQIAKTSAKNDGKREVISRATNASVQRKAERPVAEIKRVSPMDQFFEVLKNKK